LRNVRLRPSEVPARLGLRLRPGLRLLTT